MEKMRVYLSTVASGQQDQDGPGADGLAQFPAVLTEGLDAVTPQLTGHVLCGVVTGLDTKHHKTSTQMQSIQLL